MPQKTFAGGSPISNTPPWLLDTWAQVTPHEHLAFDFSQEVLKMAITGDKAITKEEAATAEGMVPDVPEDVPRLPEIASLIDDRNLPKNLSTIHEVAKRTPSAVGDIDEDFEEYATEVHDQHKVVAGASVTVSR